MMKHYCLLLVPFFALACTADFVDEHTDDVQSSLNTETGSDQGTNAVVMSAALDGDVSLPSCGDDDAPAGKPGKKPVTKPSKPKPKPTLAAGKPSKPKPVPECSNGALPGAMTSCAPGYTSVCQYDEYPYCCTCEEEPPPLSCANVLCAAGHTCIENCGGEPECVPQVCGGIAGVVCPTGFSCNAPGEYPDQSGECEKDCALSCGECLSDDDCGKGEDCTASDECLAPCDSNLTVCAGQCVAQES